MVRIADEGYSPSAPAGYTVHVTGVTGSNPWPTAGGPGWTPDKIAAYQQAMQLGQMISGNTLYPSGPSISHPVPFSHNPTSTYSYPGPMHVGFRHDPATGHRPDQLLASYNVKGGGNKWFACMMDPNYITRMPYPDGGYGTAIVIQKLWVDITTDANGDARWIVSPYTKFPFISVAPATGVQTPTACPDETVIAAKVERMRPLHTSVLFSYYGNPDDSAGIIVSQTAMGDATIATWNEDADALSHRLHSHSSKVYEGAYAYAVNDPTRACQFNQDLFRAATTGDATIANSPYCFIKQSVSGASVSTTIGRCEIIVAWEIYSEDQLWTMHREANHVNDYWEAYYLQDLLNVPRVFTNDLHNTIINMILSKALGYVGSAASAAATLGLSDFVAELIAGMKGKTSGKGLQIATRGLKRVRRY